VRRLNRLTRPIVIRLPRQVDAGNAEEVAGQLRAEFAPDKIIVADMAKTMFCDSRGTQELLGAHYWARALECELRVARPCSEVLRVWQLLGANEIFAIYPTIVAARQTLLSPHRSIEGEVIGTGVLAGELLAALHEQVVEQAGRADPEQVRSEPGSAGGLVNQD